MGLYYLYLRRLRMKEFNSNKDRYLATIQLNLDGIIDEWENNYRNLESTGKKAPWPKNLTRPEIKKLFSTGQLSISKALDIAEKFKCADMTRLFDLTDYPLRNKTTEQTNYSTKQRVISYVDSLSKRITNNEVVFLEDLDKLIMKMKTNNTFLIDNGLKVIKVDLQKELDKLDKERLVKK